MLSLNNGFADEDIVAFDKRVADALDKTTDLAGSVTGPVSTHAN